MKRVPENSQFECLKQSRLPSFYTEWIHWLKGTSDYFGLNHYYIYLVEPALKVNNTIWMNDTGIIRSYDPKSFTLPVVKSTIVPRGIRNLLRKIKEEYNNPLVYITESGISDYNELRDFSRIQYLYSFMKEVLHAIKNDKCDVKSYIVWSLIDSWELVAGYKAPFGLIYVDFSHLNRTRTPKV